MTGDMRSALLTVSSFFLTAAVIGNGYYQKKQFYPSVVYITKSNASMAVLYIQAFVLVVLMGKFMRKIFFGQLRAAEMEHLIERSWYAVTETCLAFTVFRDDFSPRFVAAFTLLLFLKSFHWLAEDRVDYMERSPLISFLFHARVVSLLLFLGSLDMYFMNHAYYSTLRKGASVQLVFGFEYAILSTSVVMTFMKYIMHTIDLQNENPWENKAVYLLYTELLIGGFKVALYLTFMGIMIKVHTFPLFAIRPMYIALRAFKKALHDVVMSRRAIHNMNTLYDDATPEDIQAGDSVCIICREEMTTGCKKLPCSHIYHTSCLRSWFQRQQTCPTCRMDVLRVSRPTPPQPPQAAPQQPPVQPQMHMPPFNALPPGFPHGFPMWPPAAFPPQPPPTQPTSQAASQSTSQSTAQPTPQTAAQFATADLTSLPTSTIPMPNFTPPFIMPMPPPLPMFDFPSPPENLSALSAEQLSALEGHERQNVEMRIRWLRDIHVLLDTAMMLVNQYNDVAATINIPHISVADVTVTTSSLGARPKTSTLPTYVENKQSMQSSPSFSVDDAEKSDEASGFTPPSPDVETVTSSQSNDAVNEVRRRRLEKFASPNNNNEM